MADFIPHNNIFALIIFVVAALTDMADGKIARKRNLITNFGKIADPIADKILSASFLLGLMLFDMCSVWVVLIILTREFAVSAIRISAASQGLVIPANIYGKIKTVMQMVFSILVLVLLSIQGFLSADIPYLNVCVNIMMWILAFVTLFSGFIYMKDSLKVIDFSK
jgi:CDP-diacylglycerol--glycerol-3-phosphate 3-phosphatidyltransferase